MFLVLEEDVLDEGFEGWLEGGGGLDEANDEVVGDDIDVLYAGREVVSERGFRRGRWWTRFVLEEDEFFGLAKKINLNPNNIIINLFSYTYNFHYKVTSIQCN